MELTFSRITKFGTLSRPFFFLKMQFEQFASLVGIYYLQMPTYIISHHLGNIGTTNELLSKAKHLLKLNSCEDSYIGIGMTTYFAGGFCYLNRMLKALKHSIRLVYFYFIFQSHVGISFSFGSMRLISLFLQSTPSLH